MKVKDEDIIRLMQSPENQEKGLRMMMNAYRVGCIGIFVGWLMMKMPQRMFCRKLLSKSIRIFHNSRKTASSTHGSIE